MLITKCPPWLYCTMEDKLPFPIVCIHKILFIFLTKFCQPSACRFHKNNKITDIDLQDI